MFQDLRERVPVQTLLLAGLPLAESFGQRRFSSESAHTIAKALCTATAPQGTQDPGCKAAKLPQ